MKQGHVTLHFKMDDEWFTWFLRHLWVEGNEYKAILTWISTFPHLSSPEYLKTVFLAIVSGKNKFTGTSDGPNGFDLKPDKSKYWSPQAGGSPSKKFPLIDSWEDVILRKKANLYINELRLINFRANRCYGHTHEENGHNIRHLATEENNYENNFRMPTQKLFAEILNIGNQIQSDKMFSPFPLPEHNGKLPTLHRTSVSTTKLANTTGSSYENENMAVYNFVEKIISPIEKYFDKKYGQKLFIFDKEEIKTICNVVDKKPSKKIEEIETDMSNLNASLIVPGLKLDIDAYIQNINEEAKREVVASTDISEIKYESGYITREGKFFGCHFLNHSEVARKLCVQFDLLHNDPPSNTPRWLKARRGDAENPEKILESKGWIRISANRFYWLYTKPNKEQIDAMRAFMEARNLKTAIFNGITPITLEEGLQD